MARAEEGVGAATKEELRNRVKEILRRFDKELDYDDYVFDADFEDIKRAFEQAGYVQLDEDQTLPNPEPCGYHSDFWWGRDFLVKKGWRKVKEEK